ncbi:MAG TPA: cytochrome c oxidase assembly protein [Pirellulaceae bacterium]|nr:cytochrome c oxidase assembly protein [Pirellulaceae bacterium]
MSPTLAAGLRSWPWDPWLYFGLLLTAAIYLRGWWQLRQHDAGRWSLALPVAFVSGLVAIWLALASPIEPFASLLLQVHMVQHLLLMMVVAPLIWLGAPYLPLLRGLPKSVRQLWLAPFLRSPALRRFFAKLTHPVIAWVLYVATTWLWHAPRVYDAALAWPALHYLQHVCFLAVALLFWYPVVRPYPSRPRWSQWLLLPYLLLADVQNTVLSGLLTFSDRVLYEPYTQVPRLAGISALDDQATAGVLMWVPGSVAFLGPLCVIGIRLMYGQKVQRRTPRSRHPSRLTSVSSSPRPQFDLLRVPMIGAFLRWRHARIAAQVPLLIVAGLVIVDGLRGPPIGAMNLAGVLPWIHWRGLLVVTLLAAGNFFCFACPFTLPRKLASHWLPEGRPWPRWLRGKWLAVALLMLFLWAYEAYALWDSPWWTAWIAIGYFVTAFAIDGFFRRGSFCKYVCPIGQFNFVQSLISPLEVGVRSPSVCASCTTHECLRGSTNVSGCELLLFQPTKQGNLDCTFCLDCTHACPHDNIGIVTLIPSRPRIAPRLDLAVMIYVLVFGAFANAAGMVGPVVAEQVRLSAALGQSTTWLATTLFYLLALIVGPCVLLYFAAGVSRAAGKLNGSHCEWIAKFATAFVPIGFAMWLAHYSFHFLTSWETIIPVVQRFSNDHHLLALGAPLWDCACCRPITSGLIIAELLALDIGLLWSLQRIWKLSTEAPKHPAQAVQVALPWAMLVMLLFVVGVWIVFQPMEMRGTLPGGG